MFNFLQRESHKENIRNYWITQVASDSAIQTNEHGAQTETRRQNQHERRKTEIGNKRKKERRVYKQNRVSWRVLTVKRL